MKAIKKEIVNSAMATTPIMEIDPAKIGTVSSSKDKIVLPYSGAELATISFNIQPGQFEKIHLSATIDGHAQRLTVEATREEIKNTLQRFFFDETGKTHFSCGLDPYWLGIWQAHFIDWTRA